MLRIVTDSHIPPAVTKAARKLAAIQITPLRDWHGGVYLNDSDPRLLAIAWEDRITFATYDLNTFPLFVKSRLEAGLSHAGVIYISARFRQTMSAELRVDWSDSGERKNTSIGQIAFGFWTDRYPVLRAVSY